MTHTWINSSDTFYIGQTHTKSIFMKIPIKKKKKAILDSEVYQETEYNSEMDQRSVP